MALLKRKAEKSGTISVRIPESAKIEMKHLRGVADARGFDLAGSLTDAVVKWIKQLREELGADDGNALSARKAGAAVSLANGKDEA